MRGKRSLVWIFPLFASIIIAPGCGKSGTASKNNPSFKGSAVATAITDSTEFTKSVNDPFNSVNGIESTRKQHPGAFGVLKGERPPATPTIESVGVAVSTGKWQKLNVSVFEYPSFVRTTFPFDYENDNSALKQLYALHSLDKVIQSDMNDMSKGIALMVHTKKFLDGGTQPGSDIQTGPSAFLITKNRREKGIGGGSDVYAALLCQLALSCGMSARLTGMHCFDESGTPLVYDVCEVFLNDKNKWAVFDPFTRGTYYTKDGMLLSALEMHMLVTENRAREITPVPGNGDILDIASIRDTVLPRFRNIYIWRMNDILGKSPRNGSIPWEMLYQSHLVWEDVYAPVSAGGYEKVGRFSDGGVKYVTHARSDFEWTLNGVSIIVQRIGLQQVTYYFDTITPNFNRFELLLQGKQVKTGNVFTLDKDIQDFTIQSVNALGVGGPLSTVNIGAE